MQTEIDVALEQIEAASGGPNVALLNRIADYIGAHPEEFDMYEWGIERRRESGVVARLMGEVIPLGDAYTVGCIACHTLRFSGRDPLDDNAPALAQDILGLSYEQAHSLFYVENWPGQFEDDFNAAADPMVRAWIARERIRHFIATGE